MKPMMLHRFESSTNLDVERVNDNLERGARDVQRNLDRRYTYCGSVSMNLEGVVTADDAACRRLPIRRPGTNNAVEVCQVEVTIYGSGAAGTATLTCSDAKAPALSFEVVDDATVECTALSTVNVSIPSSSADVTWTLTLPAGYTVTAGEIRAHLRCDRGNQGTSHAGYTPTLLDSTSSTAGSLLDTELTALATAVSHDTTNDVDLRCESFSVRSVAGTARTIRLPSGKRRYLAIQLYVTAAAGTIGRITLDGTLTTALSTGLANSVFASATKAGTMSNAPMTRALDSVLVLDRSFGAGTLIVLHGVVWWS